MTPQAVHILCMTGARLTHQQIEEVERMVEDALNLTSEKARPAPARQSPMGRVYLEVVAQMRTLAFAQPYRPGARAALYRRRLPGGMTVEFYLNAPTNELVLACAREDEDPTPEECAEAREAFGGPMLLSHCDPVRINEPWHVVKYHWKREHHRG